MYKALIDIGDYKKGDVVPDEKAVIWQKMYLVSPVVAVKNKKESIEDKEEPIEKESKSEDAPIDETEEPVEEETPTEESPSEAMFDDYLNRNNSVVKKNIEKDNHSTETLNGLLELEKSNKNRKDVIKAIKRKLENGD